MRFKLICNRILSVSRVFQNSWLSADADERLGAQYSPHRVCRSISSSLDWPAHGSYRIAYSAVNNFHLMNDESQRTLTEGVGSIEEQEKKQGE